MISTRVGGRGAQPSLDEQADNSERVTDHVRVISLLQSLRAARALLSVRLNDSERWFNSSVVKVDTGLDVICLDELTPEEGHHRVTAGTRMHVVGIIQGVPLRFDLVVQTVGSADNIAFYAAPIPEVVDYQQRRALFRAHIPRHQTLQLKLRNEQGQLFSARLLDLSLGGFGALAPSFPPLLPLESIEVEHLDLPGGESISATGQVRYIQDDQDPRRVRIGILFVGLKPQMQRLLLRSILTLEREQIRKQSR